jgi:D-glycero-alpha-D-manno-heptose 1-phosphate guanylyltransferase
MSMEAIVLAGGLGTRLRDTVPGLPKPMAPVAGRPFLCWLLDHLERAGFEHIVLSVGHLAESIIDHFGNRHGRIELEYAVESSPLGTGGAVLHAMAQCRQDSFFVINGDTFLALDYPAMQVAHLASGADFTMAVREVDDVSRYGRIILTNGRPSKMEEKSAVGPGLVNAGVYLFERRYLANIGGGTQCSLEKDIIAPRLARGCSGAFPTTGYFIDIGIPTDFLRAQTEMTHSWN